MNNRFLLLVVSSFPTFLLAMESTAPRDNLMITIQAEDQSIEICKGYANACSTLKNYFADISSDTFRFDGLKDALPLIKPYFIHAYTKDSKTIKREFENISDDPHSIQKFAQIIKAFHFLDSDFVRDSALEMLAQKLTAHKNKLLSCLSDKNGSYGLEFIPDLERLLAQKMIALIPKNIKNNVFIHQMQETNTTHHMNLGNNPFSVQFSQDGTKIASKISDTLIKIYDFAGAKEIAALNVNNANSTFCFNHEGTDLACALLDHTIQLFDCVTGKAVGKALTGHSNYIQALHFNAQGTHLTSVSCDNTIRIWDVVTGKEIENIAMEHLPHETLTTANFNIDGTKIALVFSDGIIDGTWNIRIFDMLTRKIIQDFKAKTSSFSGSFYHLIFSIHGCFSPDSTKILLAPTNTNVRIWDVASGAVLEQFSLGYFNALDNATYNPDGSIIAVECTDSTIRLFDTTAKKFLGKPLKNTGCFASNVLHFNPSGTHLVTSKSWAITLHSIIDNDLNNWYLKSIKPEQVALMTYLNDCLEQNSTCDTKSYSGITKIDMPEKLKTLLAHAQSTQKSKLQAITQGTLAAASTIAATYLGYRVYKG